MPSTSKRSGATASPRATVVVVGSINMDLVTRVPSLPTPGQTLTSTGFQTLPGGKGANQAVAVSRLGGRSVMVGRVGDDAYGTQLLGNLRREGVDTRRVGRVADCPSGLAMISVEDSGQNVITIVPGANGRMRPRDLAALEKVIAGADALLCQLEIPLPTVAAALRLALKHEVFTVLDAAPVPKGGLPGGFRKVDILSPNQVEAALLTGLPCDTPPQAGLAARKLVEQFDANVVVVKLGAAGALADAGIGDPYLARGFKVRAVDTTAAGDAFTAALTLRLAEGATLGEAIRFANAAGALATTRPGAQDSMPTRAAVERFLRSRPKSSS